MAIKDIKLGTKITDRNYLTKECKRVNFVDTTNTELEQLVRDLIDTAVHHARNNPNGCLGLAANQIGSNMRVIAVRAQNKFVIMINPRIKPSIIHGRITKKEGCLSCPGETTRVKRYKRITVIYTPYPKVGENPIRESQAFAGMPARVIQHEIDHLDGKLI